MSQNLWIFKAKKDNIFLYQIGLFTNLKALLNSEYWNRNTHLNTMNTINVLNFHAGVGNQTGFGARMLTMKSKNEIAITKRKTVNLAPLYEKEVKKYCFSICL